MTTASREKPSIPICKLAEYSVSASPTRRRSIVREQLKQALGGQHRWWHRDARAAIRRFLADPDATRYMLRDAGNRLRDRAAREPDEERIKELLASARAIEAFTPIAEDARVSNIVASPGKRDDGRITIRGVSVIVAPDILFLEKRTEIVIGAMKLHTVQSNSLDRDGLQTAASILYSYLVEHGERPRPQFCRVVDVFSSTWEATPRARLRRMKAVQASCDEIKHWWEAMFEEVQVEVERSIERKRRAAT
jgi:hypothetical protein